MVIDGAQSAGTKPSTELGDIDGAIGGKRSQKPDVPQSGPGSITPAQEKAYEQSDNATPGANDPALTPPGTNWLGFATGGKIAAPGATAPATLTPQDLTPVTIPPPSAAPTLGNTAVNGSGIPTGRPTIPSGAITYLRQNPNLATQFDAKYGQGASGQFLGGQNGQ
jgi:hypothetical protein